MTAKKETYNSQPRLHAHVRNAQYLRSAAQHSAARHNTKQLTDQSINQSITQRLLRATPLRFPFCTADAVQHNEFRHEISYVNEPFHVTMTAV